MRGANAEVKLHSSSVYCFELLISQQGQVIEHESFYDFAWRRFGMEVSANALYQSISMLRKALSTCGDNDDFIITIPRRGFVLSNGIKITSDDIQDSLENTKKINEDIVMVRDLSLLEKDKNTILNRERSKHFFVDFNRIVSTCNKVLIIIVFLISIPFIYYMLLPFIYSADFDVIKKNENGCKYYINENSGNDDLTKFLHKTNRDCKRNKYVYINSFIWGGRVSTVQCEHRLSYPFASNCLSYYYAGEEK
ncbi:hypothetical protein SMQE31_46390 (plasmid) [Serratia marcescens]|nr:hypothetical protein SMQE31_46390 [Serratia marcescens]